MTTLRRTFQLDDVHTTVLVTVNLETGVMHVATRDDPWETWSHPLTEIDRQDDTERGRKRGYDMTVFGLDDGPVANA